MVIDWSVCDWDTTLGFNIWNRAGLYMYIHCIYYDSTCECTHIQCTCTYIYMFYSVRFFFLSFLFSSFFHCGALCT